VYQGLEHERRCIDARECVDQQHQPIVHLIAVGHVYTLCHYILKGNSIKDVGENKYTTTSRAKGTLVKKFIISTTEKLKNGTIKPIKKS
jgi:hypothetical protein